MVNIKFYNLSQSEYDALTVKNEYALYFTNDTKCIYKGSTKFSDQSSIDEISALVEDGAGKCTFRYWND